MTMNSSINTLSDLDELDQMLIRELEQDGRIGFQALASKLGTNAANCTQAV